MIVSVSVVLTLAVGVNGSLAVLGDEQLVETRQALLAEYVDSILDWDAVVAKVPSLAHYAVEGYISIRGKRGQSVIIAPDLPILWASSRWVSERDPHRSFWIRIDACDSVAGLREDIALMRQQGYEVQDGKVITGFLEETSLWWDGTERITLSAFAARHRIQVSFTVITLVGRDPLVQRTEIEALVELVKERLSSNRLTVRG